MTQWVKVLAAKPEDSDLIPAIHIKVERKNIFLHSSDLQMYGLTCVSPYRHTCARTRAHTHMNVKIKHKVRSDSTSLQSQCW